MMDISEFDSSFKRKRAEYEVGYLAELERITLERSCKLAKDDADYVMDREFLERHGTVNKFDALPGELMHALFDLLDYDGVKRLGSTSSVMRTQIHQWVTHRIAGDRELSAKVNSKVTYEADFIDLLARDKYSHCIVRCWCWFNRIVLKENIKKKNATRTKIKGIKDDIDYLFDNGEAVTCYVRTAIGIEGCPTKCIAYHPLAFTKNTDDCVASFGIDRLQGKDCYRSMVKEGTAPAAKWFTRQELRSSRF